MSGRTEIKQLQVGCANSERGSQLTGTVSTISLNDHIAYCQFVLVPYPNKCEEDKGAEKLILIKKHLGIPQNKMSHESLQVPPL